jgi:hypothetical protein
VIVAVPTPTAVTTPVVLTVATEEAELVHVNVTPVIAFPTESKACAVSVVVLPTPVSVTLAGETVTDAGAIVAVNVTGEPVRPALVAVTVFVAVVAPSVSVALAVPIVSVRTTWESWPASFPPPTVTRKATRALSTPLPSESRTATANGAGSALAAGPVCPLPETATRVRAGPCRTANGTLVPAANPLADAVRV